MALTALMGTYHHNIDAKGRMSFPTKLRDLLGGEFYVTKSINQKCLTIYSKEEWEKLIVFYLRQHKGTRSYEEWSR